MEQKDPFYLIVNTMTVDDLAMEEAKASATMILMEFWNILATAAECLKL